jgi:hypothetical protein
VRERGDMRVVEVQRMRQRAVDQRGRRRAGGAARQDETRPAVC